MCQDGRRAQLGRGDCGCCVDCRCIMTRLYKWGDQLLPVEPHQAQSNISLATYLFTLYIMSARRPADDAAAGQPDPKRAKVDTPPAKAFDISSIRAQIAAKKAEAEAKLRAAESSKPAGPASLPPAPKADPSLKERAAAAKARIEALNTRKANPYLSGSGSMPKANEERAPMPALSSSIALHPLLMGDVAGQKEEKNEKKAMRDRYKPMAPKFSTVKANVATQAKPTEVIVKPQPSLNPYAAKAEGPVEDAGRRSKKLNFAAPGRYVKQGDALRNEQKMEALRLRIMEKSRKAGLDSEFDSMGRSLKVCPSMTVLMSALATSRRRVVGQGPTARQHNVRRPRHGHGVS